jgi:hypothetical protein
MVGAALGVPVELAMPANVSEERKKIIKAYGAKVYLTDPLEGTDGAILFVRELVEREPREVCVFRSIQQSCQLEGTLLFYGYRALASNQRSDHPLGSWHRHRWNHNGHGKEAKGLQPRYSRLWGSNLPIPSMA